MFQRLNNNIKVSPLFLLLVFIACGGHKKNGDTPPGAVSPVNEEFETHTDRLDSPSQGPKKSGAQKSLWVGDLRALRLVKVDPNLNTERTIDLSAFYPQGGAGITAMSFIDSHHLAILLDPQLGLNGPTGGGGQMISLVNTLSGKVAVRDFGIGSLFQFESSQAVLANPQGMPSTFLVQTPLGIERYLFTNRPDGARLDERVFGESGGPYLPHQVGGECPIESVTGMASLSAHNTNALLVLSGGVGANRRLTVVGSLGKSASPKCLSSYLVSNDEIMTPTDVPVAAEQLGDGRVYVVYQGPSSKVVRYEFDGTQLSHPYEINKDSGVIGSNPRGIVGLGQQGFIVGSGRKLAAFTLEGEPKGHLTLSNLGEVGALAREPQSAPEAPKSTSPRGLSKF